jgi:L-lactate dehydrogenase complex protein LldG
MRARKEILDRLSSSGRKTNMPYPWRSKREYENLQEQFAKALKNVKGEVHHASGLDEAWNVLGEVLSELGARKIVVNDENPLNQVDLVNRFPDLEWYQVGKTDGNLRDFCASADVGLTSADVALAETGSVLVSAGPGRSRAGSLLPPVHIVILPISKLVPDIFTWTANREREMSSQVVLISGPSKTADIEQTLVVGVHGPKRFIVILYSN